MGGEFLILHAPAGCEFVECWSGVDSVFRNDKTVDCYGVVLLQKQLFGLVDKYQAVLKCATANSDGICTRKRIRVKTHDYAIKAVKANVKSVCDWSWNI